MAPGLRLLFAVSSFELGFFLRYGKSCEAAQEMYITGTILQTLVIELREQPMVGHVVGKTARRLRWGTFYEGILSLQSAAQRNWEKGEENSKRKMGSNGLGFFCLFCFYCLLSHWILFQGKGCLNIAPFHLQRICHLLKVCTLPFTMLW